MDPETSTSSAPPAADAPPACPWWRGITARTGFQGKLVLGFMFLLTAALGASCWRFATDTRIALDTIAEGQALDLGRAMAMAGESPLADGDVAELNRLGADLMKNRGVLAVAFFDPGGAALAVAASHPDLTRAGSGVCSNPRQSDGLLRPRHGWLPETGAYVQLSVPATRAAPADGGKANSRLVGYVTVCLGQRDNYARLRNVQLTAVLIGAVAVLVSLPVMYGLVNRAFRPIRQLVAATDKIAAGQLDTRVAIDRPDVIGTLARSFNEMVNRVKRQQDDLAAANAGLESANRRLAGVNRELEEKVRLRTAELEAAARQLTATNGRLSREIADKEDFLRAVSHDLNAPLRNIAGMATMLLMKHRATFDEDVVHRLERILKNVTAETDLIAELLELSRLKTRRQKMEPVDLDEVVRELGDMFAQDLETRRIQLVADSPLPPLVCERARFRQVFQNLIDNAIKYMGDESVEGRGQERGGSDDASLSSINPEHQTLNSHPKPREIHVGCAPGADGPEFYVRDTGIGIDADDLDKVFCVFRRGRSQAVQGVAGKGVGLASVKSIIEMYDGTIRVDSRIGEGSTFRFTVAGNYLPAAGEAGPAERGRAA